MPITYQTETSIPQSELLQLYKDANWTAYTKNPEQLEAAIQNSLYVLTARADNKLVGLIRVVGDGFTISYIQDILVLRAYQRQKIGTTLMERVLAQFQHIRQKVLLTDDRPTTRAFYEALGFAACDRGQLVAFVKLENEG